MFEATLCGGPLHNERRAFKDGTTFFYVASMTLTSQEKTTSDSELPTLSHHLYVLSEDKKRFIYHGEGSLPEGYEP